MSFFSKYKTCFQCEVPQALEHFHRDRSTTDGYAASCKVCRNAKRQKPKITIRPVKIPRGGKSWPTTSGAVIKIPIIPELDRDTITKAFLDLRDRLGTSFSLSVDSRHIFHLQAHGNPSRHFRAKTMEELMEMV